MKWTILGLSVVGIIAAVCAAVLVAVVRAENSGTTLRFGQEEAPHEMTVLVATEDIPAMTMVKSSSIAKKSVMSDKAPEGAVTELVQVVGHVLTMPVLKDEAFTKGKFAKEGEKVNLATALPPGGRAFNVLINDENAIEGLLYPGCTVDVVASFRLPAGPGTTAGEIVSATLLQGVQVLAVGPESVASKEKTNEAQPRKIDGRRRQVVTLLVDTRQSEALQLATTHGEIALVMRNPLDREKVISTGMMLTDLSEELSQKLAALRMGDLSTEAMDVPEAAPGAADATTSDEPGAEPTLIADASGGEPRGGEVIIPETKEPGWKTIVYRGRQMEEVTTPLKQEPKNADRP